MLHNLAKFVRRLSRGERGITGLETAIIMIAFVTVAAVLAYTVLSAGIFSSERGKETVYGGLQGAQASMEIKGSVVGLKDAVDPRLGSITFSVALVIPGSTVDMDAVVANYWDGAMTETNVTMAYALSGGSTERGTAAILEGDEQMVVTVTLPATSDVAAYDTFTVQLIPPNGATLTIQRTMPGAVTAVMPFN